MAGVKGEKDEAADIANSESSVSIYIVYDQKTGKCNVQHNVSNQVVGLGMLAIAEKIIYTPKQQIPAIHIPKDLKTIGHG